MTKMQIEKFEKLLQGPVDSRVLKIDKPPNDMLTCTTLMELRDLRLNGGITWQPGGITRKILGNYLAPYIQWPIR